MKKKQIKSNIRQKRAIIKISKNNIKDGQESLNKLFQDQIVKLMNEIQELRKELENV